MIGAEEEEYICVKMQQIKKKELTMLTPKNFIITNALVMLSSAFFFLYLKFCLLPY